MDLSISATASCGRQSSFSEAFVRPEHRVNGRRSILMEAIGRDRKHPRSSWRHGLPQVCHCGRANDDAGGMATFIKL